MRRTLRFLALSIALHLAVLAYFRDDLRRLLAPRQRIDAVHIKIVTLPRSEFFR